MSSHHEIEIHHFPDPKPYAPIQLPLHVIFTNQILRNAPKESRNKHAHTLLYYRAWGKDEKLGCPCHLDSSQLFDFVATTWKQRALPFSKCPWTLLDPLSHVSECKAKGKVGVLISLPSEGTQTSSFLHLPSSSSSKRRRSSSAPSLTRARHVGDDNASGFPSRLSHRHGPVAPHAIPLRIAPLHAAGTLGGSITLA